jgi:hypothetical protein
MPIALAADLIHRILISLNIPAREALARNRPPRQQRRRRARIDARIRGWTLSSPA